MLVLIPVTTEPCDDRLNIKSQLARQLEQMQLPEQLITHLDQPESAIEVQNMLSALDYLAQQWH